eukprot:TRINITY_DN16265_c0_g1_i1.p1 TRINITY_DN16265_c0_g1~~TRINITY_DN16265_c0_g1_i1.p1  ORF type:complete len:617 (-),score=154.75 TRINITY_DN16265_c0_g1_i1:195-2045(-)
MPGNGIRFTQSMMNKIHPEHHDDEDSELEDCLEGPVTMTDLRAELRRFADKELQKRLNALAETLDEIASKRPPYEASALREAALDKAATAAAGLEVPPPPPPSVIARTARPALVKPAALMVPEIAEHLEQFADKEVDDEAGCSQSMPGPITLRTLPVTNTRHTLSQASQAVGGAWRRWTQRVIESAWFEVAVAAVIFANACFVGYSVHYVALAGPGNAASGTLDAVELLFTTMFAIELALRFFVYGKYMYLRRMKNGKPNFGLHWNYLDTLVVSVQLFETLAELLNIPISFLAPFSILRCLRLLKVLRVVRLLRVFYFVYQLRMIVFSIWSSLSIFVWSCVAVFFLTFVCGVWFCEVVTSYSEEEDIANSEALRAYFGSLPLAMLSLVKSVTGGADWGNIADAFWENNILFAGFFPFLTYVAFTTMAMMNVITGVFLDTAIEKARDEREVSMARKARYVFSAADKNNTGMISYSDFEKALEHAYTKSFFKAIDIDMSEARSLFELLDSSGDGTVNAEEFMSGCLRVRGSAKSLDLLVLSREVQRMFDNHHDYLAKRTILRKTTVMSTHHHIKEEAQNPLRNSPTLPRPPSVPRSFGGKPGWSTTTIRHPDVPQDCD